MAPTSGIYLHSVKVGSLSSLVPIHTDRRTEIYADRQTDRQTQIYTLMFAILVTPRPRLKVNASKLRVIGAQSKGARTLQKLFPSAFGPDALGNNCPLLATGSTDSSGGESAAAAADVDVDAAGGGGGGGMGGTSGKCAVRPPAPPAGAGLASLAWHAAEYSYAPYPPPPPIHFVIFVQLEDTDGGALPRLSFWLANPLMRSCSTMATQFMLTCSAALLTTSSHSFRYAPYTHGKSGVAILAVNPGTGAEVVAWGGVIENAAFDPTADPMQVALIDLITKVRAYYTAYNYWV